MSLHTLAFYMKSGNVIKVKVDECKWEKKGGEIISLEWTLKTRTFRSIFPELRHIDVSQIEAIVNEG